MRRGAGFETGVLLTEGPFLNKRKTLRLDWGEGVYIICMLEKIGLWEGMVSAVLTQDGYKKKREGKSVDQSLEGRCDSSSSLFGESGEGGWGR